MSFSIEYDYQIFSLQKHGGISRYFAEIASRMAIRNGVEVSIRCPFFVNEYLRGLSPSLVQGKYVRDFPKTARLRHWLNGRLSRHAIPKDRRGVRHLTYYGGIGSGRPNVVTVYDMAHERFPQTFPKQDRVARNKIDAVKRADAVICISHHTRKELLERITLDPDKVHVTHLGFTPLRIPDSFAPPAKLREAPFILYVGIRAGYKNFDRLLKAYGNSKILSKDFRLICLGGGHFNEDENRIIRSLGLENRVLQLSADDGLLAYCYSHANVFAYPSFYEGFGIPPLEAMASGCPVVCGHNSSLPEVVADAACIIDPLEEGDIARGLESILYSEQESQRFRRLGKERSSHFSWDKCAEETMAVYRRVCAEDA